MRHLTRTLSRIAPRAGAIALVLLLGLAPARATCVGDCDGGGSVTVDEIITLVNIVLGTAATNACPNGVPLDAQVDITFIIAAVNNALNSCPTLPTATPTPEITTTPTVTDTPTITATPTITPTLGVLGTRHFLINSAKSPFVAVLGGNPPFAIPVGNFNGQVNNQPAPAYLDLAAGQPDATGLATIDVVGAPDYITVDGSGGVGGIVLCLKPILPVMSAGVVACNGGYDFSVALNINHHLGQVGVDGFTAAQCANLHGTVESPNQICAAGGVGNPCRVNTDCDSTAGASDGMCGLSSAKCSAPAANLGNACHADGDCDTSAGAGDGVCGQPGTHPGVCNGDFQAGQLGGDSGPGSVNIAPVPEIPLNGLPMELTIEHALPCGDEGSGPVTSFAFTTGKVQSTIFNVNDRTGACSAPAASNGNTCQVNSDCDSSAGAGDGVCGQTLTYATAGHNFACSDWQNPSGPGCLVLTAPQLDSQGIGDLITVFKLCAQ